jgi:group I intron endonuclease
MIIYLITNNVNGKVYVGKTNQSLKRRWSNHKSVANQGHGTYLHNAIRKYGADNFSVTEVLVALPTAAQEDLSGWEREIISAMGTTNHDLGYNLTEGGEGSLGFVMSEETKLKMRNSHLGVKFSEEHSRHKGEAQLGEKNHQFGRKYSEEEKHKLSDLLSGERHPWFGLHHSDETKQKISENLAAQGRWAGENNPKFGKSMPEEHKLKLREANRIRFNLLPKKTDAERKAADNARHRETRKRKAAEKAALKVAA